MSENSHWKTHFDYNYLGGQDLTPGQELILTIKSVADQEVTGTNGRKEICFVCEFVENAKPMILNKTNCKIIEALAGTPQTDKWPGTRIQIYFDPSVKFGKDTPGGLRIRKTAPKAAEYFCQEEGCGKKIEAVGGKPAAYIAEYTRQKYGKALCSECASKYKAAKEAEEKGRDVL